MNLIIGSLVGVYFLTGLLLYVLVVVKVFQLLYHADMNCSTEQIINASQETIFDEFDVDTSIIPAWEYVCVTLMIIIAWPTHMQKVEEMALIVTRRMIEKMKYT